MTTVAEITSRTTELADELREESDRIKRREGEAGYKRVLAGIYKSLDPLFYVDGKPSRTDGEWAIAYLEAVLERMRRA